MYISIATRKKEKREKRKNGRLQEGTMSECARFWQRQSFNCNLDFKYHVNSLITFTIL